MKTDASMMHGSDTFMSLKNPAYLKKVNSGVRTNAVSISAMT